MADVQLNNSPQIDEKDGRIVKGSARGIRKKGEEFYKAVNYKFNNIHHKDFVVGKTKEAVLQAEIEWKKAIKEKNVMKEHTVSIPDVPFDLDLPEKGGFSIVMIGASRSGKTTALKYCVKKYMDKKLLFLTSFNDMAEIYKDLPKRVIISSDFHPEIIKDFHTLQHETDNKYKACMIFDDAIGNQLKNDKEITKLLTIYRNADMSSIFSAQSSTLVSPAGRSNANFILLFRLNASSEAEHVCKDFLRSYFPKEMSMNERVQWYMRMTQDHYFIYIDNINNKIGRCKLSAEQLAID